MAIQFVRDQLIDAIINPSKMDLTTGTYNFGSVTALTYKTPTSDTEVAIKSYVDSVVNGLNWKDTCRAASTTSITGTYNNGSNGIGATLTVTNSGITQDGVTLRANDRILLKNQSGGQDPAENGIYELSTDGNALGASGDVRILNASNTTAGAKGFITLSIVNNGNLVNNTSNLVLTDFSGNTETITFGDASDVAIGATATDTFDNLATYINGLNPQNFQVGTGTTQRKIYFSQVGVQASARTASSNAMTAFELNAGTSSPVNFTNGSQGDQITFTKADNSTVIMDLVTTNPGRLGNQFEKFTTEQEIALSLRNSIVANPDLDARISNDAPTTVIVSLVTTGTSGNGKAISYSVTTSPSIGGDTSFENGQAVTNSVLTRTTDFDVSSEMASAAVFIEEGSVNGDNGFTCTTNEPIQVGFTSLTFVQFNGAGQITAGDGLSKSGNTLSVNVDDNSIEIVSDTLRIKQGGNGLTGGGAALLSVQNDGSTLSVGPGGVKVSDNGITATQLNTSVAGDGISGGGGTALALDIAELTSEVLASGDFLAFSDTSEGGQPTRKETVDDLASLFAGAGIAASSAVLSVDISEFSTVTPAASDSFLTLDSDGSTEQRTTTDALATLFAGSGGGLQASSAVMSLNLNDLSSAVVDPATDSIAIVDATDNSTKKEAIADFVGAINDDTTLVDASGVLSVKDGGISFAKLGFQPYIDNHTFNGSTNSFDLVNDITVSSWLLGAVVSRNGQVLKRVASSPADSSEYTIVSNSGTTTVTLGANPANGELLQVNYFA